MNWMGPAEFLPLDHPMAQRLQLWTDRLDKDLRTRYPEKLKGTPHPKIIIRKSAEVNAWVSALPGAGNNSYTVTDTGGVSPVAGASCSVVNTTTVTCSTGGVAFGYVDLGDGNDTFTSGRDAVVRPIRNPGPGSSAEMS